MLSVIFYVALFIYAVVIGSFLNVCILRIPMKETIVSKRSHCMTCGHQLAWYDLFPLFSYLALGGKCRYCKAHISKQYPIIEATNGVLAVLCFVFGGFFPHTIKYLYQWVDLGNDLQMFDWMQPVFGWIFLLLNAFVCSALLVVTVIDWRTYIIPFGADVFIFVMGVIKLVLTMIADSRYYCMAQDYLGNTYSTFDKIMANGKGLELIIGFFAVSVPLFLIWFFSKGTAMGDGDFKLMAAAGLFLGWKYALMALIFGCFYGSVIHLIRMKVSKINHKLAMGPYLAAGIVTALWFGEPILEWYVNTFM